MKKALLGSGIFFITFSCGPSTDELWQQALEHEERGEYEKAIPLLSRILEKEDNDKAALNNRAWDYYDLGKVDSAQMDLLQLLKHHPEDQRGLYSVAWFYLEMGEYEKSMAACNKILKLKGLGEERPQVYFEEVDNEFVGSRAPEIKIEQIYNLRDQIQDSIDAKEYLQYIEEPVVD